MRPFSLLIKPASADCNLRCRYCFYLDRGSMFPGRQHRMDDATLERVIRTYLQTKQPEFAFNWQGGEPTLMGLEFYKKAVAYQNHFRPPGARITNALQTNGTMLTSEWAEFLSRYQFLVGVSLDGPESIHDAYRTFADTSGSHHLVVQGIRNLQTHRVNYNILTLVSQANARRPLEVYRYIRDEIGCSFHQYIDCVEYDASGNRQPYAITGEEWGNFLCTIFDEWLKHDRHRVSIRIFDSIIATLSGAPPTMCSFGNDCRQYLVVEHNGDIFPCDFFVENEFRIGNACEQRWAELLKSPRYECFGVRKSHWHSDCDTCEFLCYCKGDCQKNREVYGTAPSPARSALCAGWKQFYQHALPTFEKLVTAEKQPQATTRNPSSPGRNDPCVCGSGRKYKKCCSGKNKNAQAG